MIRGVVLLLWAVVTAVAAAATLPGTLELLGLSLAALLPRRRPRTVAVNGPWRVAVIVPAHNEELSIAACVQSLQQADHDGLQVTIVVVADNCTDQTAETARLAGATVLVRNNTAERGKGYALHYAFTTLMAEFDCFLVVDADTSVASNFIMQAAGAMRSGAEAVQACYVARNATDTTRTRLMEFSLRAFNVLRPRGRSRAGLSAGIFGNGFGLRSETLLAVPYLATSVVEDLEYHLALVRSGRDVEFLEQTCVLGEMPVRGKGVETQRSRWEGGRLRMMVEKAPGLLADVLHGRMRSLEPMLDLLLLPLAFHVVLLVVAVLSLQPFTRAVGVAGVAVLLLHLAVTMAIGESAGRDLVTLASAPFYIAWKLLLIPKLLRSAGSGQAWVRTHRNDEAPAVESEINHHN